MRLAIVVSVVVLICAHVVLCDEAPTQPRANASLPSSSARSLASAIVGSALPAASEGDPLKLLDVGNVVKFVSEAMKPETNPIIKGVSDLLAGKKPSPPEKVADAVEAKVADSVQDEKPQARGSKRPRPTDDMPLIDGPARVLQTVFGTSVDLTKKSVRRVDNVADTIATAGGKIAKTLVGSEEVPPSDVIYHSAAAPDDPFNHDKPTYFSRDCQFRVSCEMGRAFKPMFDGTRDLIMKNKLVHDLQNRYTRAFSYGLVYNDCEKYYCLFVALMGGPRQFTGAITELANRIANPDMYEK